MDAFYKECAHLLCASEFQVDVSLQLLHMCKQEMARRPLLSSCLAPASATKPEFPSADELRPHVHRLSSTLTRSSASAILMLLDCLQRHWPLLTIEQPHLDAALVCFYRVPVFHATRAQTRETWALVVKMHKTKQ